MAAPLAVIASTVPAVPSRLPSSTTISSYLRAPCRRYSSTRSTVEARRDSSLYAGMTTLRSGAAPESGTGTHQDASHRVAVHLPPALRFQQRPQGIAGGDDHGVHAVVVQRAFELRAQVLDLEVLVEDGVAVDLGTTVDEDVVRRVGLPDQVAAEVVEVEKLAGSVVVEKVLGGGDGCAGFDGPAERLG